MAILKAHGIVYCHIKPFLYKRFPNQPIELFFLSTRHFKSFSDTPLMHLDCIHIIHHDISYLDSL